MQTLYITFSYYFIIIFSAREAGNKPPFKVYVADRVETTIRTLEVDSTVMLPYRFVVRPRTGDPDSMRAPLSTSSQHCSPLLREKDAYVNINIQPVNTRAIKLADKTSFIPPPKPPPKSILKHTPTIVKTVSIGTNTDPMPEPEIPACLECAIRKNLITVQSWTQTLPPVRHSVYVQVGRDMELSHNPAQFRFQNRLSKREVVLVDPEENEQLGFHRYPINLNLERPPMPPSPPRIQSEGFSSRGTDPFSAPFPSQADNFHSGPDSFPSFPDNFRGSEPQGPPFRSNSRESDYRPREHRFPEDGGFPPQRGHHHRNQYVDLDTPAVPPRRGDIRSRLDPPPPQSSEDADERFVRYRQRNTYQDY